ncbi:hypothetical protein P3W53_29770, partial [Pseudomonas denitrificans (nom. rej.)]|nr:hypothetical protein [Pseudomonas denitrificans (nom. rej.)]
MSFKVGHVETQGKFEAIVDDATASPVPVACLKISGETRQGSRSPRFIGTGRACDGIDVAGLFPPQ